MAWMQPLPTWGTTVAMSIGDWEPIWLGAPSRSLYAALHRAPSAASIGVVLVAPLLHEQPRSRRFVTEVASQLAESGLSCLRFDFHGTGDSPGAGEEVDFASMADDLKVATAALRFHAGVEQVALLAWRGAALLAHAWLQQGRQGDRVVLWEPILDGAGWLRELQRNDARERALRPRPRPGVPRTNMQEDGQLMGFAASPRLRQDLAEARLARTDPSQMNSTWAVVHADSPTLPVEVAKLFELPAGAPTFDGGLAMEAAMFLTPPLERVVGQLGNALRQQAG
jgi:alpha-beta hydrolase superfamily lysophospholipase